MACRQLPTHLPQQGLASSVYSSRMYALHIANKNYSSWSLRPWLLMKELGIPFEERISPFTPDASGNSKAVFRAFSPSGLVPVLIDEIGTVVWDSLAITEYLAERHGRVWPSAPPVRAWARSAAAEMHSGFSALRSGCTLNVGIRVKLNAITPAVQADLSRLSALWSDGLNRFGGPYLAGKTFSAVDAFFAPIAFRAQTYGLPFEGAAAAYLATLLALPGMKAWEAGALQETWRDASHDAEVRAVGTVLQDLCAPAA
jgi:glutathione S-transferase